MPGHLVLLLAAGCIRYGTPSEDTDPPVETVAPADDTACGDTACADAPAPWTPSDVGWTIRLALDDDGWPRTWGPTDGPSTLTVDLRHGARSCAVPYAVGPDDFAIGQAGGPKADRGPKEVRRLLADTGRPFGFRVDPDQALVDGLDDDCASLRLDAGDDLAAAALALVADAEPLLLVGLGGPVDPLVYGATDDAVPRAKVGGAVLRLPFEVAGKDGPLRDLPSYVLRTVLTDDGAPAEDGGDYRLEDAATIWDGEQPAPGWLYATPAYGITL